MFPLRIGLPGLGLPAPVTSSSAMVGVAAQNIESATEADLACVATLGAGAFSTGGGGCNVCVPDKEFYYNLRRCFCKEGTTLSDPNDPSSDCIPYEQVEQPPPVETPTTEAPPAKKEEEKSNVGWWILGGVVAAGGIGYAASVWKEKKDREALSGSSSSPSGFKLPSGRR